MRTRDVLAALSSLSLLLGACSASADADDSSVVGFIFVGERDDLGYNQAAWEGSVALARSRPDVGVLRVENVPESDEAVAVLEDLIEQGARILFATSFGHLDAAHEVAQRHPQVTVLHQGGVEPEPGLPNLGTYFGEHEREMFVAGVLAAATAPAPRFGYVAAFPIPATFNNVNAFTLGARTVEPDAVTEVRFTKSWCDPDVQADTAVELLDAGAQVLVQHQDCTATILGVAARRGALAVGYHADGSEVGGDAWVTGAVWLWEDLFTDIVTTALSGTFAGSRYDRGFRGPLDDGVGPVVLTEPGPRVPAHAAQLADAARQRLEDGDVFAGPLVDRDGVVRAPAGETLSRVAIDAMDWFVEGVLGDVPP